MRELVRRMNGGMIIGLSALMLLAACATPFEARVQRFQQMPPAQGQSFVVKPADPAREGSLEFQSYANLVANEMRLAGFVPAATPADAYLIVKLDFGVGPREDRINTRPGSMNTWGWYGRGWYGRGHPGWWGSFYDPFWGPTWGGSAAWGAPEVYSYTLFPTFVEVSIHRAADNAQVFQGRADSSTRVNDLTSTVPKLVTALFTEFPGAASQSKVVRVPAQR
jgi:Domain of unknown function (DUF4136)